MKVIQKFFIFSFLTVIFVVGIFFMLNINIQIPLYKVANKYSKPDVKWKKILYGKYQTEYENWFSENVSFRSFGLKGMNQILYAFDSLSDIDRGKSNVLFYKDWTKRFFINEEFDNFIGKKGNLDKYIEYIEYIDTIIRRYAFQYTYIFGNFDFILALRAFGCICENEQNRSNQNTGKYIYFYYEGYSSYAPTYGGVLRTLLYIRYKGCG